MDREGLFEQLAAHGVRGLHPYVPGKPNDELEREFGLSESIKLASNENPLGPPPAALAAIRRELDGLALYPDGSGFHLKNAIARQLGIGTDTLTLGNGSNDNLVLLAEAFLGPGTEAIYDEFSFAIYRLVVQATAATPRVAKSHPVDHPQPRGHDLDALRALINDDTRIVFIANPNNPTGTWVTHDELHAFMRGVPATTLVVVDEAYGEYVTRDDYPRTREWLDEFPHLVITRTFSKIYALAGLRVGYSIAHPAVAELLNRVRAPFNVNTLALSAACAAIADDEHVERSRRLNDEGIDFLTSGLEGMGFGVTPSIGNFVLADLGRPAGPTYEALLRDGIIVRPVGNYGLPQHLRITVGLPEQNERLIAALSSLQAAEA